MLTVMNTIINLNVDSAKVEDEVGDRRRTRGSMRLFMTSSNFKKSAGNC